jgi:D-alanyl-D-alanine endopeptidase (penicillin-binding protein 7)
MLHIALMSSENRAASALGRNYPGGIAGFVEAMNAKARELGMSTRITSIPAACRKECGQRARPGQAGDGGLPAAHAARITRPIQGHGRNAMAVRCSSTPPTTWSPPGLDIGLQKTGFINEAGRCLMMQAVIEGRSVIMVFLDSKGKQSRTADAGRMKWLEALKRCARPASAASVYSSPACSPASPKSGLAVVTRSSSHSSCSRSAGAEIDRPAISLPLSSWMPAAMQRTPSSSSSLSRA